MPHKRSSSNVIARFEDLRPFLSRESVYCYLDNERLECLLCGKKFAALGVHIAKKHGISARSYRVKLGLPLSKNGLVGVRLRRTFADNIFARTGGVLSNDSLSKLSNSRDRTRRCRRCVRAEFAALTIKENKINKLGNAAQRYKSRKFLLELIRMSEIGDTVTKAARRIGANRDSVLKAFGKNRDMKAAFGECVRGSHA